MSSLTDENRISQASLIFESEGKRQRINHYTRFMGEETELWIFGSGLGEYALTRQLGDSFLNLIDNGEDPHLGRIMLSMGFNPASTRPYRGDINMVWAYGVNKDNLEEKIATIEGLKPDVVLSPHKPIRDKAEELGMKGIHMIAGVGRFFKPLNLERSKIGFAGLDNKSRKQRDIVLGPALKRGDLIWISRTQSDVLLTLEELNKFYNTLKVTFGMIPEERHHMDYVPSRLFEVLASGTPLIIYKLHDFKKNIGFDYPYQTTSYEETEAHMDYILNNQERVLKECAGYSDYIREFHSYENGLRKLFGELKK